MPSDRGQVPLNTSTGRLTLNDGALQVSVSASCSSWASVSARAGPRTRQATAAAATAMRLTMLEAPIVEHIGQQVGLVVVPEQRHVIHDRRRQEDRLAGRLHLDLDEGLQPRGILDG